MTVFVIVVAAASPLSSLWHMRWLSTKGTMPTNRFAPGTVNICNFGCACGMIQAAVLVPVAAGFFSGRRPTNLTVCYYYYF